MEVFIKGVLIDLCIPEESLIETGLWVSWLNDIQRNIATRHAIFPKSKRSQYKYLENLDGGSELTLIICDKNSNASGVISLQNIDQFNLTASIAINNKPLDDELMPGFSSLEAFALMTTHAFRSMGLNSITAGQNYCKLQSWNQLLSSIGYLPYGYLKGHLRSGFSFDDYVQIQISSQIYNHIVDLDNALLPSSDVIVKRLRRLRSSSYTKDFHVLVSQIEDAFLNNLRC